MSTANKPEFSTATFYALMKNFSPKYGEKGNADLGKEWKAVVRNEFALSEEQEDSLKKTSKENSAIVQQQFEKIAAHIKGGGHSTGMIIKNEDGTHSINIFLGEGGSAGAPTFYISIVIAHCDSHCRHWHWGPAKKR